MVEDSLSDYSKRVSKRQRDRDYYQKHKEKIKLNVQEWYKSNLDRKKHYDAIYYQNNKQWKDRQNNEYALSHPEDILKTKRRSYVKLNRESINKRRRSLVLEYRKQIIERLGGYVCQRCKYNQDKRAIELDHVNNDGYKERKNRTGSYMFYLYYYSNPDIAQTRLQILCANCNRIKKYERLEKRII